MKKLKKILFAGFICMLLIFPLSLNVYAELLDESLPRVVDDADLLTKSEENSLETKIKAITDEYDFDIVIVTADTLNGKTPMEYADDYYDYNGYGANKDRDGVILLLSMEDRDWWISTTGYGIEVFTDEGIQKAGRNFVSYLSNAEYSKGFESFLNTTEDYIKGAKNQVKINILIGIAGSFAIALIAALITVLIFKSQLKSVNYEYDAQPYEVKDSFRLTRSNDIFLYRTVSKKKREQSSGSSGGGGSSIHVGSSGTTHGGGGGKF